MKKILNISILLLLLIATVNLNAQLKVKSNGYVGVRTADPKEAFQIGDRLTFHDGGTKAVAYNFYYNLGDKRIVDDYASGMFFGGGNIQFRTASWWYEDETISWYYPMTIFSNGKISIGTQTNYGYQLYILGNFRVNGDCYSNSIYWSTSDLRLKKDIEPISDAIEKITKLDGKTYKMKNENLKSTQKHYGLIAQEVQEILPDLVTVTEDSIKSLAINYDGFIPILIEALKEQQKQIEELNSKIEQLDIITKTIPKNEETDLETFPEPAEKTTSYNITLPNERNKASLNNYNLNDNLVKK